jgi:hypothetical protein
VKLITSTKFPHGLDSEKFMRFTVHARTQKPEDSFL